MIHVENLKFDIENFSMDVSLQVGEGEYFVLLGMTGTGKTVLLENLCGIHQCRRGRVIINGENMTHAEPRMRNIGYVPQDGALFEHLDVSRNIGFALEVKGRSREERDKEIGQMAELLGISDLLGRPIRGLSGGERQRVALARALVGRPSLLLLDEPVSALDEYTRDSVCRELKNIQQVLQVPVIHVCHSFEETKLVADRVGVMHNGEIIQTGTIDELLSKPNSAAVAKVLRLETIINRRLE